MSEMILIPAGNFIMGDTERADEQPAGEIWVDAFYIDRFAVTNEQFRPFVEAGVYEQSEHPCWQGFEENYRWMRKTEMRRAPRYWWDKDWNTPDRPIVGITWFEAVAFARWSGKRLPTEAEWEKAARGTEGHRFPWGNEFDLQRCNVNDSGIGTTTAIGYFSPQGDSPYGVAEMSGNIWEWTSSLYLAYPYQSDDGREELAEGAGRRVVRGGSWQSRFVQHLRCANRHYAEVNFAFANTGFRCAKNVGV